MTDRSPENDPAAEFVRLYAAHNRRIYGYIRALVHNPSDVEEVFQNTCEVLWKKFGEYSAGTNFFAWSCSIARYEALDMRRRRGRESQLFSNEFYEVVADAALEQEGEVAQLHEALADCFGRLAPPQRKMIELRYAPEGTPKRIAEQLGRTVHAVYGSLRRIHELLFRCIQRQLNDSGPQPQEAQS